MIEILIPAKLQLISTYTTPNPIHKHAKWELLVLEEGTIINYVNGLPYEANVGDVILLGPCHTHAIEVTSPKHLHRDIYFEQSVLEGVLGSFSEKLKNDVISGKLLLRLKLDINHLTSIIKYVNKLERLLLIETISKTTLTLKNSTPWQLQSFSTY